MNKITIKDDNTTFEAILVKPNAPTRAVLFAVGSGGNPERHLPLLNSLSESGCVVVAPFFERIVSSIPSPEDLRLRVNSLAAALDFLSKLNLPIVGIGHSIGATLLVGLAGGEMWMQSGQRFLIERDERLKKLVLFAPPTGFFQVENALDAVLSPVQIWAASLDTITPPEQIEILTHGLLTQDLRVIEGAGHFSFMNSLPPNIIDPMKNRDEFLATLSTDVCKFVTT